MFSTSDTIAAIATAAGRGAIGLVRISGPDARTIASALLSRTRPLEPRRATIARLRVGSPGGPLGDEVVATFFPAPHSYTTDDLVEIGAHGSPVLLSAILAAAVGAGARLAQPGEFTFRAFVNGRIDLTQAEAVADLVNAVTPLQARAAFDQLEGSLATAIQGIHERLFSLVARIEASLDFPDEGYHFAEPAELAGEVRGLGDAVGVLLSRSSEGRVLREGAQVVLTGRTNVGKSSIFNYLAGFDRAIVSVEPGTTRDLVTESIDLNGVPVTLVDTAGIRESSHPVEEEGIRRAQRAADVAAVEVVVLDRSQPLCDDDRRRLGRPATKPQILAANKSDLPAAWGIEQLGNESRSPVCSTSARTGDGLRELRELLVQQLGAGLTAEDPPTVTNVRHAALLRRAGDALDRAASALQGPGGAQPEEVVLLELHDARAALEEVTGQRTTEDVLTEIFSRFCIGK